MLAYNYKFKFPFPNSFIGVFINFTILKLLLLLSILSINSVACVAQGGHDKNSALVKTMVKELMALNNMPPGFSVAISQNNKIVFAEGFGYSDVKKKKVVTPKTQFRAASVSKMMTATALARLIQDGKINIDKPIQKYVNSYPQKDQPITARQLAGHLSGIPHYTSADKIEDRYYTSVSEALKVFSHIELTDKPNTKYNYSTHGYTLLSAVVEGAAGQPFLEYLDKSIFHPLSMKSSGPHLIHNPSKYMTELYDASNGSPSIFSHPEDPSYKWGGGGMVSTPSDLVKMGNAYLNGFIKDDIVKKMFESQLLESGEKTGVGIGWRQNQDMQGRRIYEHAGAMQGTRSVLSIFPDQKLTASLMANALCLWFVEETVHMLALPFLTEPSPNKQLVADINVEIKTIDAATGEDVINQGRLIINGADNKLIVGENREEEYSLVYLQRKNIYALIHKYGIMYTTIDINNGTVKGDVKYYKSPNTLPPSESKSFMSFEGAITNSK